MVKKRAYDFPDDVVAWLDSKPRGDRTDILVQLVRAQMVIEGKKAEQLRALKAAKLRERERIDAEVRLIDTQLEHFDEDLNREAGWRDIIRLRLESEEGRTATKEQNRFWAAARRIPLEVYDRLAAQLQEARVGAEA